MFIPLILGFLGSLFEEPPDVIKMRGYKPISQAESQKEEILKVSPLELTPLTQNGKLQEPSDTIAYKRALKGIRQKNWELALLLMEEFVQKFPKSEFADNAIYWTAHIYISQKEFHLARTELQRLLKHYPQSDRSAQAEAALLSLPPITARRSP